MLTGIKFENYKAFQEGNLELKPITILLGANSVGKSSLIQLFLMLQETALAENYKSPLKLHGGLFSLGEGINLFRKKDINNKLHLNIQFDEFSIKEIIDYEFNNRFLDEVLNYCIFLVSRLSKDKEDLKVLEARILGGQNPKLKQFGFLRAETLSKISRDDFSILLDKVQSIIKNSREKDLINEFSKSVLFFRSRNVANSISNNKEEILATFDFLQKLKEIKDQNVINLEYDFKYIKDSLNIDMFTMSVGGVEIVRVDFDKLDKGKLFIFSDIVDFSVVGSKQIRDLKSVFMKDKTIFSFIQNKQNNDKDSSVVCTYFIDFLCNIIRNLGGSFKSQRINYVSPLRAHPKRYYFLDKAKTNTFLDTLDGEAIAEILKENGHLRHSVNTWFEKFNLQFEVGPIKDVIHQIVVKQNSLALDITDVGFGVSQVLPVIIQGFLSGERSLTLIEQPEIHLHPKMQADLADLFIDIVSKKNKQGNNKQLLIETHSEYLLKRLRRRISENKISAEDVAIYYIEPQELTKSAEIKKIDISAKGAFDWPRDFYTGDLADDVSVFLKNQI